MIRVSEFVLAPGSEGLERHLNSLPGRIISVMKVSEGPYIIQPHHYGYQKTYEVVWEDGE